MALLGAKLPQHAKRRHGLRMSCLPPCWMVLSRDRWQHPFMQASFQGSTGVLHSAAWRSGWLSRNAAWTVGGRSSPRLRCCATPKDPSRLASKIMKAEAAAELLNILDGAVHSPIFQDRACLSGVHQIGEMEAVDG